jgi:hypothetical protein
MPDSRCGAPAQIGLHGDHDRQPLARDLQGKPKNRICSPTLKAIGINVDITALPTSTSDSRLAKPGEPWDIAWTNWGADFDDPFTMINELFDRASTANNFGRFNDSALTRRMAPSGHAHRRPPTTGLRTPRRRSDGGRPAGGCMGIGTFREFFSELEPGQRVLDSACGVGEALRSTRQSATSLGSSA